MRASHKKRIARLVAALGDGEREVMDRRCRLRFYAVVCADVRAAMEWRGIDPGSSRVLLDMEAKVARFVDAPELRAADELHRAVQRKEIRLKGEDPWQALADTLDDAEQRYLDGSLPNFTFVSLMELWAWSLIQYRLLPAIPDSGYGVSVNTSLVRGIVE
jgi:hypothetical protein